MNLVVIDTRTHEVRVFSDRKMIAKAQFDRSLSASEVESLRLSPKAFFESLQS